MLREQDAMNQPTVVFWVSLFSPLPPAPPSPIGVGRNKLKTLRCRSDVSKLSAEPLHL